MGCVLPSTSLFLLLLLLPLLATYADQGADVRRSLLQKSCLDWSDTAASAIAEAACLRASGDCPRPTLGSQSGDNPANPLDRLGGNCYTTNKDQCLTQARGYISGGYGMCEPALTGIGPCSDDEFNVLAEKYLRKLCAQAGNADPLTLP
ncbi:hypothetical protein VOLCADRAFT_87975 [Volvox carteri f. nagariensis]|uniref:Uncharacterized protein n=1 Tax=Volvox carteri f. nagariensis TaxID=3068 RepID=D8TMR3_VOLCA|nr:uncharacterized protein VOLCADRAFT_87975 [Volvox carteri f. nagariensis]EFJ51171.1 hypothetical protein VOLCADRAFT_87975 [Volvox carteri f. nagariensis]|eukprot:XP_002947638.1 hypothetical protein VOLCADRAFT_87975 [Volvox carteri f. nagariensis]